MDKMENKVIIIAEVGQNHQGDLDYALEYIRVFSSMGADAIKFQTRNNKYLFSNEAYNKFYDSENSFADTYGNHREKLELKPEWLPILKKECVKNKVKFMSTPFDEPSLDLICDVGVDLIKIASFDLGNLPFINLIGEKGLPVVMSTGGGNLKVIKDSVNLLIEKKIDVTVLHCVSEYPTPFEKLGLDSIPILSKLFPNCIIGLSDHFSGILSGPIGYMKGARVFEKHVTLNRAWKGTDHPFSLEPNGFRSFARDIRRAPLMLKPKSDHEIGKENVFSKLGKSIVANKDLYSGDVIGINDLSGKIFDQVQTPVRDSVSIIGRILKKNILQGDPLLVEDLV